MGLEFCFNFGFWAWFEIVEFVGLEFRGKFCVAFEFILFVWLEFWVFVEFKFKVCEFCVEFWLENEPCALQFKLDLRLEYSLSLSLSVCVCVDLA